MRVLPMRTIMAVLCQDAGARAVAELPDRAGGGH